MIWLENSLRKCRYANSALKCNWALWKQAVVDIKWKNLLEEASFGSPKSAGHIGSYTYD